jgi:hypothetical protein
MGIVTPRLLGLILFAASATLALWRVHRDRTRDAIILAAAFTCFSSFILCTEMTERYILAALPFFLLLTPSDRRFVGVYALLTVTAFVNIYVVFPLVRVTPWDALQLPHSNFFYYLQPEVDRALPVLRLVPNYRAAISLWVAAIHVGAR